MRRPMSRADRAKQFLPFSPLDGLDNAFARKAQLHQERILLGEDAQAELDRKLRALKPGAAMTAVYYSEEEHRYISASGVLRRLDSLSGTITVDTAEIALSELSDIKET